MKIPLVMGDALRRNAAKYPLKVALRDSRHQITYRELNDRVNRLANGLLRKGIRKGDPVGLLVGNRIEHLDIIFALAKIGALGIPLDIKWRALEISSTLSSLQVTTLFLEEDCREEFNRAKQEKDLGSLQTIVIGAASYGELLRETNAEEPAVEVEEDDPFLIMLTSGTTGFPKGCLVSHRAYAFSCINNSIEKGLGLHDTALLSSPIYFNHGRAYTLAVLFFGGSVIIQPRFDPAEVLRTIERDKVTYLGAVPTMCERLLQVPELEKIDTSSLRCLSITGGRVHPPVFEGLKKHITPNIFWTYAATDSGQMTIAKPKDTEAKPLSSGRPVWCGELRIVDESGNTLPSGQVGEILSRSPLTTQGYYKNPDATELSFRDGWYHTGDLGYFDDEGYLFVAGRKKDMIKSGGISVFPLEIEEVLYRHPDVLEAAVVGLPDPEWGEKVQAAVVLKEGAGTRAEGLVQFCKERLASYKIPKSVDFFPSLPHTNIGKVDKGKLKEEMAAK
jgi:acyl-CoA synthetase (AMP-forming)/AMP-acid ligase II